MEYVFNESKKEKFKRKAKDKIQRAKWWIQDNKEFVIGLSVFAGAGAIDIGKRLVKRNNLRRQEAIKNLYCYDRSLGHYWRLRRELSNKEWLEIDRRKNNGERLSDILSEMKVLK